MRPGGRRGCAERIARAVRSGCGRSAVLAVLTVFAVFAVFVPRAAPASALASAPAADGRGIGSDVTPVMRASDSAGAKDVPGGRDGAPSPQVLRAAIVTTTVDGITRSESAVLPYHWDRRYPGRGGFAVFELSFSLDTLPDTPWTAYVERVGNRYEVRVNGELVAREGDPDAAEGGDFAKVPRPIAIPPRMLRTENTLRIEIAADPGRRGGLSPVIVGPGDAVLPAYRVEHAGRVSGTLVVIVLALVAGTMALTLWLMQVDPDAPPGRRRDPLYLYVWLAEYCYALRMADVLLESPPLPWPAWSALTAAALGAWIASMVLVALMVGGRVDPHRSAWLRAMPAAAAASGAAAGWSGIVLGAPILVTAWQGTVLVLVVGFSLWYVVQAVRRPAPMQRLLAAALVLNVAVGARDWAVFRLSDAYGRNTWIRYSAMAFGASLAYVALRRFLAARAQARELNATLARRIAEREAELALSWRRLGESAREQARAAERVRILGDMHDGVGTTLATAIRRLEASPAGDRVVLAALRESLDRLKLSVDALTVDPGDVTGLLASLRHRLEPRLEAAGLALDWDVDELAPVRRLDLEAMRSLQSLLAEAVSNVLQHSGARRLHVSAADDGEALRIALADDGRGFDASSRPPRSLHARAAALGARLSIDGAPGRCRVEVVLPRGGPAGETVGPRSGADAAPAGADAAGARFSGVRRP